MMRKRERKIIKQFISLLCAGALILTSVLFEPVFASEELTADEDQEYILEAADDEIDVNCLTEDDDFTEDTITEEVTDDIGISDLTGAGEAEKDVTGIEQEGVLEPEEEVFSSDPEAYENEAPLPEGAQGEAPVEEDLSGIDLEADADELARDGAAAYMNSGQTGVPKLSMYGVADLYRSTGSYSKLYDREPVVTGSGYKTSKLTGDAYTYGRNYINYYRRVAGLKEVSFSSGANDSASWGALVLAMIRKLTHTPSKPSGMSDSDYNKGKGATSSSNISYSLGYGEGAIIRVAVQGQMADSSGTNLTCLGHRRWLLRPGVTTMGIGSANNGAAYYTDVKVFGDGVSYGKVSDYDFISWPSSGNNLSDTFGTHVPWSITLNPDRYSAPSRSAVTVTMQSTTTGKKWVFNKSTSSTESDDTDYFNVNNDGYGVANCIIFRPGILGQEKYSGEYIITVSGIKTKSGSATSITYRTEFDTYEHAISNVQDKVEDENKQANTITVINPAYIKGKENMFVKKTAQFKVMKGKGKTTWSSSDPSVVTVNKNGKVKAVSKGKADIIAVNKGKTMKMTVNTFNLPRFEKKTYITNNDVPIKLVTIADADLTGIVYTVSNKKVASVDSTGLVTPIKKGTVTVTGKVNGYSFKTKVKIYNPSINGKSKVKVKKTIQLKIKNGRGTTTWVSSNPDIATITSRGKIKGISQGTVTITAVNNGRTMTREITVY